MNTLSLDGLIFESLIIEKAKSILTITLNRPEKKNAINPTMANELVYALSYAKASKTVRVLIIQATGTVFCAGGDLAGMAGQKQESRSTVPKTGDMDDISLRMRHINKPVICKIQGSVYAGALLILCNASHVISVKEASFSTPEIKRGIWPFMVMAGLFRVMPKRQALDFIMRGEKISAQKAVQLGLINEAVDADKLDTLVASYATQLAHLAPNTMTMGLAAYNTQENLEFDQALPYLKDQLETCLKRADAKEGIAAFLEKREPRWEA